MKRSLTTLSCAGSLLVAAMASAAPSGYPQQMIVTTINPSKYIVLGGNTRPEANAANDKGAVPDSLPLNHMLLQLRRSPEREAALQQFIADLNDRQSENYHQWLTPAEFAAHYGAAGADAATA